MKRALTRRDGFSLLEVLVACGLLVLGLSSFAALLPAASSRLAEAAAEDRAGTLSANAWAEIISRGLAASDLFPTGSVGKACVFGRVLPTVSGSSLVPATAAVLNQRIEATRGFALEDELVYQPPQTGDTPVNSFLGGGAGPREYRDGACWAAMLMPLDPAAAVGPGSRATLSVAVFRKAGDTQAFTLTPAAGNYSLSPAGESTCKRFARGCSYLLVLATGQPPDWRRINASWTNAAGTQSYLNFTDSSGLPAGPFTAIGFEGLMRLDERTVVLD
jgi:hypothetical protein